MEYYLSHKERELDIWPQHDIAGRLYVKWNRKKKGKTENKAWNISCGYTGVEEMRTRVSNETIRLIDLYLDIGRW